MGAKAVFLTAWGIGCGMLFLLIARLPPLWQQIVTIFWLVVVPTLAIITVIIRAIAQERIAKYRSPNPPAPRRAKDRGPGETLPRRMRPAPRRAEQVAGQRVF